MVTITKVDKKGRILLKKELRERIGIKEESNVKIKVVDGKIIIEPLESIADKYFGIFHIDRWPEDLDNFVVEIIKKWRTSSDI